MIELQKLMIEVELERLIKEPKKVWDEWVSGHIESTREDLKQIENYMRFGLEMSEQEEDQINEAD